MFNDSAFFERTLRGRCREKQRNLPFGGCVSGQAGGPTRGPIPRVGPLARGHRPVFFGAQQPNRKRERSAYAAAVSRPASAIHSRAEPQTLEPQRVVYKVDQVRNWSLALRKWFILSLMGFSSIGIKMF